MSASESDAESPPTNRSAPRRLKVRDRLKHVFSPERLAWALCLTLLVDGLAAIALAVQGLQLTYGPLSPVFAAAMLALGLANLVAMYSLLTKVSSWQLQCTVAQVLIAFLALYIVVTAMQSRPLPWWGWLVTAAATVLGIAAIGWLLLLIRTAGLQWSKPATVIVALFPLAGLVQFWFQSDYLPTMTDPLVDVSADLSPIGRAQNTIRLSAKVTVHNRGQAKLYEPAGLLRVTAYRNCVPPNGTPPPDNMQQSIAFGSNTDNVFRANPIEPGEGQSIFAADIAGTTTWIEPGGTVTTQREVDLDSTQFCFARLSATQLFFTDRPIRNVDGPYTKSSMRTIDYYIGQRSAVRELVAGYWLLRIQLNTRPPVGFESPQLYSELCTEAATYYHQECPRTENVTRNNPVLWAFDWAEYGPTDHETNQK
jgi:hypothetical protein